MLFHAFALLLRVTKESVEFTIFFQSSNRPSYKMVSSLTRDDFMIKPRKHSYCLLNHCTCFSHQMWWWVGGGVGLQVNKFEQISNLGHQMPLARG